MNFHLTTLEFDKILSQIKVYAKSESAKNKIMSLQPLESKEDIILSHDKILECMEIIIKSGDLNLINDYDIKDILREVNSKRLLSIKSIQYLRLFLVMSGEIVKRSANFSKENIKLDKLNYYFDNIKTFEGLLASIDSVIAPDGVILDNASEKLYKIRKEIKKLDERRKNILYGLLQKKASILNESLLVMRNDRLCLPVKTEFKNQIKGIIHDTSSSQTTTYIEPIDAYNISTELINLEYDEKKEIENIIYELVEEAHPYYDSLILNMEIFIELDKYFSIANYSNINEMIKPTISNNTHIIAARHPLIDRKEVVPVEIKLSSLKPILMITGPNTGGKTVLLKTLGLLSIMNQSGLLIPAKKAEMAIYNGIYADIGDKQSIVQNLSTFSSHILNIKGILDEANNGSLLLFDELGSGTDPKEGVSLAKAIINYAIRNHIYLVLTTHYSELKAFSYENVNIETASVRFNDETLEPLYLVDYGRSGASNALKIAKRLKLKEEILKEAYSFLEDTKTDLAKIISTFEDKEKVLDKLTEETKEKEELLKVKEEKLTEELKKLELNKQNILKELKEDSRKLLKEQEAKFKEVLKKLESVREAHEIAELKHEVSKLGIKFLEESDEDFKVGDHVYIKSYDQNGVVTNIKKDDYYVKFGHFELSFKKSDLLKHTVTKKEQVKRREQRTFTIKEIKAELDLRGFRAIDVKEAYLKFIDDAILANLNEVKVIHGYGTGAVKKALYDELKKDKNVLSYRFGGQYEGTTGVTIITLNKT